jgi:hypothetical protein
MIVMECRDRWLPRGISLVRCLGAEAAAVPLLPVPLWKTVRICCVLRRGLDFFLDGIPPSCSRSNMVYTIYFIGAMSH